MNNYMPTNSNLEKNGHTSRNISSPNLNQGKKDNLNRLITASEIEPLIKEKKKKNLQTKFRDGWLHCRKLPNIQKRIC